MSASLSSLKPTWYVVLPWLEQLGPEQLIKLQRMGGPAQWWLHETPEETSARRPYMDDVFDLLASFLGWGEGGELDARPLNLLLPSLPQQMPTAELGLEGTATEVLQAVGGTTLADVAPLTPLTIACMAKVRIETKRDILAALVRAAALFPQSGQSQDELAPTQPEPERPDRAVQAWFVALDARQQDLITLHLCARVPAPVDALAVRYRTMRSWMTRLLEELPQQLQEAALASPKLTHALQLFDSATQSPITRSELTAHHPWLSDRLPGSEVAVLDLLLALNWSGSSDGTWLFSGSLAHARELTLNVLGLTEGEALSLPAAGRLLQETGYPLKATEQWLEYCGLSVVDGQQVVLAPLQQVSEAPRRASAVDDSYVLAPPSPATASAPAGGMDAARRSDLATPSDDIHPEPEARRTPMAQEVLEELRVYACRQRPGEHLADLLRDSEELPEPLRTQVARMLAAVATPDGWQLPDDAPGPEAPDDFADLPGEEPAATDTLRRVPLADRALAVLEELGHPLDWPLLIDRMGAGVNARSLKNQLSKDDRFVRSDVNSWALAKWGLRPYTSIKELIGQEVDRAGGSLPTDELVAILTREFTIAANSVRVSASTSPFTVRKGVVRRLIDVHAEDDGEQPSAGGSGPDDGPSSDDLINLMGL